MKTAILFSGQGQQFAGMGADLYAEQPIYRATIDAVNQQLAWDLRCDDDWLDDVTRIPVAITAMNLGLYQLLQSQFPQPTVMTGLSLGEYSALIAAKVMSVSTGIKLVADRARYMERAGLQQPGQLVAALKVTPELVEMACRAAQTVGGRAYPANYNLADQIVLGGDALGIQAATAFLKTHGIKRVVPLSVAVASHTPLMTTASTALAKRLDFVDVRLPQVPVISNTTGQPFTKTTVKTTLTQQLVAPTHFDQCLQAVKAAAVDMIIQVGPGHNLAKFAKQTIPTANVFTLENSHDWQALMALINGGVQA